MTESKIGLEVYQALVDDAFRNKTLNVRQNRAAEILSTAQKHFTREEFKELESYVFERLEK